MDDAESVDPEIFDTEFVGHEDSIGDCWRDGKGYSLIDICVNVRKGRLLRLVSTPDIAQVAVMTSHSPVGLDKTWLRRIRTVNNSSREVRLLVFGAVLVVLALVDALHRSLIVRIRFLWKRFDIFTDFFDCRIPFNYSIWSVGSHAVS